MTIEKTQSPIRLNGLDFIEYVSPEPAKLKQLFEKLGFVEIAKHKNKEIFLFQLGDCHFVINNEPDTFAQKFSKNHSGPAVCSIGFRVDSLIPEALEWAKKQEVETLLKDSKSHSFDAIYGVGGSLIYFVDDYKDDHHWKRSFDFYNQQVADPAFLLVDHLTNNVQMGAMKQWCDFYEKMFGFTERRFFDIRGAKTGLNSKVMRSPCDTITIPINEPSPDEAGKKSQIQEYIDVYNGAGIQHIALKTENIISAVEQLKSNGLSFLEVPDTYYDSLKKRVPIIEEDIKDLKKNRILVDGNNETYLLQIFTQNVIGPIFYEIIQRKGHDGFGEGNFQALFDAIERDQIQRGYL